MSDLRYCKKNSTKVMKANPMGGSTKAVLEKIGIEAKQPNSAIRNAFELS